MIDRKEAERRAREAMIPGEREGRVQWVADAILQAVTETAQECAGMVEDRYVPVAFASYRLSIADKIRTAFGIQGQPMSDNKGPVSQDGGADYAACPKCKHIHGVLCTHYVERLHAECGCTLDYRRVHAGPQFGLASESKPVPTGAEDASASEGSNAAAPLQPRSLKQLRADTNDAIGQLETAPFLNEAINWANLSCVEAASITTDEEDAHLRVLIEEASPDCQQLQQFIRERLAEKGWKDVEVATEW